MSFLKDFADSLSQSAKGDSAAHDALKNLLNADVEHITNPTRVTELRLMLAYAECARFVPPEIGHQCLAFVRGKVNKLEVTRRIVTVQEVTTYPAEDEPEVILFLEIAECLKPTEGEGITSIFANDSSRFIVMNDIGNSDLIRVYRDGRIEPAKPGDERRGRWVQGEFIDGDLDSGSDE